MYEGWACPSTFFGAKDVIWTFLVLNLVNIMYWDDPCRENEILAYMVAYLINGKVEYVPWFKAWFVILFGYVFGKMKVLEWPLWKNEIVAYMITCFDKYEGWACPSMSLDAKHDIWTYLFLNSVNIKYCGWPLLRKRDISLYGCKFDKCEGWICPLI